MWTSFRKPWPSREGANDCSRLYTFQEAKTALSKLRERDPLYEALGLESRRLLTKGLTEKVLWLATEMAYDRACLGMEKLYWISISDGTIKNLVVEEGTEIAREKEEERNKVWERGEGIPVGEGKGRVFVQVDSTGINDRSTRGMV